MATTDQTGSEGTCVAAWVSPALARELKELADRDRRSISSLIRIELEDLVAENRRVGAPAGASSFRPRGAETSEEDSDG